MAAGYKQAWSSWTLGPEARPPGRLKIGGVRFVGHGGGAPGMNGDLEIDPHSGYVIAVLANLDPPAATRISEFIVNRLAIGVRR